MLKNAKYSDLSKWLTKINNNLEILSKFSCTKIFNVFERKVIVWSSKMFVHLQIYESWNLYSHYEVFFSMKNKSWKGFLFRKSLAYCCNAFLFCFIYSVPYCVPFVSKADIHLCQRLTFSTIFLQCSCTVRMSYSRRENHNQIRKTGGKEKLTRQT